MGKKDKKALANHVTLCSLVSICFVLQPKPTLDNVHFHVNRYAGFFYCMNAKKSL